MLATVYTRRNCKLCDEAKELLEQYGLEVESIDVDDSPELQARYTECVPVVLLDGRERFRGRVNEVLLQRLIRRS